MSDDLNRLKERLEKDPDSLLFAQYADLLRKNGKLDEAIEIAEKGVGKHNEYATGFLVLGRCFKEKKVMENAIKHLETASKLDKQSILALKELSELYRDLNDKINAKRVLNRLLELDPLDREAKTMLREIEEKELKEEEGVEEEGLSSYFESAEYEAEAEEEELVVEEEEIVEKPKTSFEEIDFEEIPKEEKETELTEVLDEEEVEVEEVTEEEIKSMFAFDEEVGEEVAEEEEEEEEKKEAAPAEELVEVFKESEGFPAEGEPEEEGVRTITGEEEDKEEKIEEEVEFEDVFGKEEVSKEEEEEEESIFGLGEEVEALDVVEKEKEGIEGEEVAPTLPAKEEEEVIEEVTTETAKGREVSVEGEISLELAEIYQRRGFNGKALEAYKRLYEQSKDEEIKKRIDELEGKINARDLSANKEEAGGEGIFSQLDKKAPIEKEGFKKEEEISKKLKGEEEERDTEFKDWIDGLSGA